MQVIVYDANVLYPSTLRDVLIRVVLARPVQPKSGVDLDMLGRLLTIDLTSAPPGATRRVISSWAASNA